MMMIIMMADGRAEPSPIWIVEIRGMAFFFFFFLDSMMIQMVDITQDTLLILQAKPYQSLSKHSFLY
jgi:hypothetical protein